MTMILGDCLTEMAKMPDSSIDFIVTDSPFGISFMSKHWDQQIPDIEYWQEMLRVCKPGAMMAAAGLPRMYHRLACVIEDAGWQIRDCILHLFGSGFPKSHNHFGFEGYGTALKPAYEPWILAMKPLEGTFEQNAQKWGVAGINIDESRIPTECNLGRNNKKTSKISPFGVDDGSTFGNGPSGQYGKPIEQQARWPSNLILSEEAADQLNQMTGILKSGSGDKHSKTQMGGYQGGFKSMIGIREYKADSGGASRFFYTAKASSKERNAGLEGLPLKACGMMEDDNYQWPDERETKRQNYHPTVKPLSLMRYIIKLLAPPGNPICLDPFAGSGSTLCAASHLGINCIGIEKEPDYYEIAKKRIEFYGQKP